MDYVTQYFRSGFSIYQSFDPIYITKPAPDSMYHLVQILSSSHPKTATLTLKALD